MPPPEISRVLSLLVSAAIFNIDQVIHRGYAFRIPSNMLGGLPRTDTADRTGECHGAVPCANANVEDANDRVCRVFALDGRRDRGVGGDGRRIPFIPVGTIVAGATDHCRGAAGTCSRDQQCEGN